MNSLSVGDLAPDFELPNHEGELIRLSDICKTQNALLVFNIGFAWPHCRNHMAQLRHDYEKFKALNTEILVMVPNGPFMINRYLSQNPTPYIILTDKSSKVAEQYFQVKQFFTIGTPTVFVVDQNQTVVYTYYAKSAMEEPGTEEPLAALVGLVTQ